MDNLLKITELVNNANLDSQLGCGKEVAQKHLINTLNYINFQDRNILVSFKHTRYDNIISLEAIPQPCLGDRLDCIWTKASGLSQKLKSYKFQNFSLTDGHKVILVKPELIKISEEGISFKLPEACLELNSRKVRRHPCEGINVEFIQSSAVFHGSLLDFNAVAFCIEISVIPPQSFQWINTESTANIIFKSGQDIIYSEECRIIRHTNCRNKRAFILEPLNDHISRFKPKQFRSSRHRLLPSPNIIFTHPLTKKMINLTVEDLSGSGISVEEYFENSVLLAGMIIPRLEIEFASDFKINCKAQVVYRNAGRIAGDETYVKCGVAVLDMDIQDQVMLSGLLHQATNKNSYVCSRVDLDDLWKLFFEAGFVYPAKYAAIYANKEKFRETYEKLYMKNPHMARHFIYQDKGMIQGHMSMVRFYEKAWLFHHHASRRPGNKKAGLIVLNQIGRYVNDFYRLFSTHMNFVMCYFRPDNRFPNRVFGGFAGYLKDPKGCSLDSFAHFQFSRFFSPPDLSCSGVHLVKTQPEDLLELECFYKSNSGGLMLDALDLEPGLTDSDELSKEYFKIGFKRERHVFSLKKDGDIKAVIMVNVSDIGLNMSNLTNCIHVFVLDSDYLPRNTLYFALSALTKYYEQDEIPVLVYPASYAESQFIPCDKTYNLWVLNIPQSGDIYLRYMENLLSRTHHEYL